MFLRNKLLVLIIVSLAFLLSCSQFSEVHLDGEDREITKDEAYALLSDAERAYAKGVIHNMNQEWQEAEGSFEKALSVISMINIDREQNAELAIQIDRLLQEIAYSRIPDKG